MATRKLNDIKLLRVLNGLDKSYFTVADLEKVLELKRPSLYVLLNRLVKSGTLIRLKKGVYQPEFQALELEKTASQLYYPAYVSFESALSGYGILSQVPYSITLATTRRTKTIRLAGREIEYRQIKTELFFGFKLVKGIYLAEPEKAVVDQLYMVSRGKASAQTKEWDWSQVNRKRLRQYGSKFPKKVQQLINTNLTS